MRRQFFEAKYAELEEQLFAPHREAFPPESHQLDDFLWAVATVRSRVHSPLDGEDVALVPLADLVRPLSSLINFTAICHLPHVCTSHAASRRCGDKCPPHMHP